MKSDNARQIARRQARFEKNREVALQRIRSHVEGYLNKNPDYGDTIVEWEVTDTDYGVTWVKVINEMVKLPELNYLRIIDRQHWLFEISPRGAVSIRIGPKSYQQFEGRKFLGLNIRYK